MVLLHDMGQSLAHLLVHAIFSTKDRRPFLQSIIGKLATRKRFVRFLNVTGSPSTNAMLGIEAPEGRTPFQGGSLYLTSPRAEAPDFAKPTSRLAFWRHLPQHEGRHSFSDGGLGYSIRPLRGHGKMFKLQRRESKLLSRR